MPLGFGEKFFSLGLVPKVLMCGMKEKKQSRSTGHTLLFLRFGFAQHVCVSVCVRACEALAFLRVDDENATTREKKKLPDVLYGARRWSGSHVHQMCVAAAACGC
jgi:hypothetical protein